MPSLCVEIYHTFIGEKEGAKDSKAEKIFCMLAAACP
jgi:hypothetical protein